MTATNTNPLQEIAGLLTRAGFIMPPPPEEPHPILQAAIQHITDVADNACGPHYFSISKTPFNMRLEYWNSPDCPDRYISVLQINRKKANTFLFRWNSAQLEPLVFVHARDFKQVVSACATLGSKEFFAAFDECPRINVDVVGACLARLSMPELRLH